MDTTVFHHATAVQWHYIVNSKTIGRDSMMIHFIRHPHPLTQDNHRRCISRTDLPLDALGKAQAQQLSRWFQTHPIRAVYTSPLLRCRQTAEILSHGSIPVHLDNRLCEMSVGEWENLSFDEIRTRWPGLYALRGEHMGTTAPPGGESFLEAGKRLAAFLSSLPDESGDISIVTHGGILRGWLCSLLHIHPDSILSIPQPWSGITTAQRIDGRFTVSSVGRMPFRVPDSDEIEALYALYGTSANVQAHCRAVAECALSIAQRSTVPIDQELLRCAALLHDLCR
ncbi:MAG: histidine phosphatase family protein, partial [Aristaeellaceae bacterium]